MKICVKCKHLVKHHDSGIWYDLGCGKVARPKKMCPVTGEMVTADSGVTVKDVTYAYCRDINHGDCEMYEEKS